MPLKETETVSVEAATGIPQSIFDAVIGARGADQQRIAEHGLAWLNTLLRKNRDYGSSAWKAPVLKPDLDVGSAILCRMSDKIERIGKIAGGNTPEVDESLNDTINDLGAYCLLYLARP